MFKRIIQILLIILLLIGVAYIGVCVVGTQQEITRRDGPKVPDITEAAYSVTVEATGRAIFCKAYEQHGSVYIFHEYWELEGMSFKYHKDDLILDSAIYGKITVRRR